MTGYGKAEACASGKKITAEIRSLNSKQLDLTIKLPPDYRSAEYEIRTLAVKALQRGKADLYIFCENTGATGVGAINRRMFDAYYRQLTEIGADHGMKWNGEPLVAAILRLPEVVQGADREVPEEEAAAIRQAVEGALANLETFRTQEGEVLSNDMLHRVDEILRLMHTVEPFEISRVEAVRKRIREGIEAVGVAVDQNRLAQEMIFYIEKLDITEEKVRLANHCAYFREVAAGEESVGRKLGFIAQEMGREINTLGSKANEASIQKIVVQMKDELEKIKEQLLNVL